MNYGEIEKQRQESHSLSNQTGLSLNFNVIIFQKALLGKLKIMHS